MSLIVTRNVVFIFLILFTSSHAFSQITITATSGNMGPTNYTTLKAGFDAINAGTHQGMVTILVNGNTTETVSCVLNGSGTGNASYSSILLKPDGGTSRTISGAIAGGIPMIDLNGADFVTIDGLNTNGNSLTISNTTASATTGTSTIRMQSDATNNVITNCSILGSANMHADTDGGTIWIGAGTVSTGNDNNTISYCNIGPAGSNLPSKCIYLKGFGPEGGSANSGNIITDNNIYDFFHPSLISAGLWQTLSTSGTTISNNRFYQTAPRVQTGTAVHRPISISSTQGNNFQITGNIIGFANSSGTGTYSVELGVNGAFQGIYMQVGNLTASSVQGNIISNIAISGAWTSNGQRFVGIFHSVGWATIGDITGNIIGSQSEHDNITVTSNSTLTNEVIGIYYNGIKDWVTNNNAIGGITATCLNTGPLNIYGIKGTIGSSATYTCLNNIIGGPLPNSIQSNTSAINSTMVGIHFSGPPATISNNIIRNMTTAGGTGTGTNASLMGICILAATTNHTVAENAIYNLENTNATDAHVITGIQFTGSTGTNLLERNFVHSLTTLSSNPLAEVNGIRISGANATYQNNMIALGQGISNSIIVNGILETAGFNNFYHNSIYIGGAPVAGTSNSFAFNSTVVDNTRNYRNNIFYNARTNNGASGKHYAISIAGSTQNPPGLTIDDNIYFTNGTGGMLGYYNGSDVSTLALWQATVGQDAESISADPQYINPTTPTPNLHLNPSVSTPAEASGDDVGTSLDCDGEMRSSFTPTDIGADAGNFMSGPGSIVTNTNDSGSGSLRDVILAASPNAIITFSPSLANQTIVLTSGEIVINKNLVINAQGVTNLVISGNNASRIFHLQPGKNLVIENIALQNATAMTNGGAMYVEGGLILENVVLQNNYENGVAKSMTLVNTAMLELTGLVELRN